jgi:murein DD-endopeptidase MepM/ murein hydrolase activator NlpD
MIRSLASRGAPVPAIRSLAAVLAFGGTLACSSATVPTMVDCSVFPLNPTSSYVLPYAVGREFRVSRTFDHYTTRNGGVGLYAIDIVMPIGTPLHAARTGRVVAVEERFADGDRADFHENWVMVQHTDGTVGRYIHITRDGALVEVGQEVAQGQLIALSGDSGPSGGPHLHFDVQRCGPNLPPGYNRLPCGQTIPVSFRNTQTHSCGLVPGRHYRAEPFVPDPR